MMPYGRDMGLGCQLPAVGLRLRATLEALSQHCPTDISYSFSTRWILRILPVHKRLNPRLNHSRGYHDYRGKGFSLLNHWRCLTVKGEGPCVSTAGPSSRGNSCFP